MEIMRMEKYENMKKYEKNKNRNLIIYKNFKKKNKTLI